MEVQGVEEHVDDVRPPVPITPVVIVDVEREPDGGVINPLAPQTPRSPIHAHPASPLGTDVVQPMDEPGPSASRRQGAFCGSAASSSASDSDTADDAPLLSGETRIRIDMPGEKPVGPHDRFPKEKGKTIAMTLVLCFSAVLNEVVLSYVHERLPDTDPLPDLTFSLTSYYPEGLKICEIIMIVAFTSTLVLIVFHRHRWVVFRRLMTIGSLLYLMRCVTLLATQVPKADPDFACLPKLGKNGTAWAIILRGLKQVVGLGLNIDDKGGVLCGDYIYSGHTIVLSVSALFISEYSPRRWWPLHWLSWLAAAVGVGFLVISRGHYTIDVILSYFICTRVFWNYHTLAAHPTLRNSVHNHHRKEFWFILFRFLETNIQKPVPRRFDSPIPLEPIIAVVRRRVGNARIE